MNGIAIFLRLKQFLVFYLLFYFYVEDNNRLWYINSNRYMLRSIFIYFSFFPVFFKKVSIKATCSLKVIKWKIAFANTTVVSGFSRIM